MPTLEAPSQKPDILRMGNILRPWRPALQLRFRIHRIYFQNRSFVPFLTAETIETAISLTKVDSVPPEKKKKTLSFTSQEVSISETSRRLTTAATRIQSGFPG